MTDSHPRRWHGMAGSQAPGLDSLSTLLSRQLIEMERKAEQANTQCRRVLAQLAAGIYKLPQSQQVARLQQARALLAAPFASPAHLADNLGILARAVGEEALGMTPPLPAQPQEVAP